MNNQESVDTSVEVFCGFFRLELQTIMDPQLSASIRGSAPEPPQIEDYKKALATMLLDGLAAIWFPSDRNRERFIGLITEFADWRDGALVSVPILARLLAQRKAKSSLQERLDQRLGTVNLRR